MAKSRSLATNLARVFDASPDIVYVVQRNLPQPETVESRYIVYANEACLKWLDMDFPTLKVTPLIYSTEPLDSSETPLHANRIRGLAIPFSTPNPNPSTDPHTQLTHVFVESGSPPQMEFRLAQIIPLAPTTTGKIPADAWLVIAQPNTSPQPRQVPSTADKAFVGAWHAALAQSMDDYRWRHSLAQFSGDSIEAITIQATAQACLEAPLLNLQICGPAGSGKEHLARTLVQERQKTGLACQPKFYSCTTSDPQQLQETMRTLNPSQDLLVLLNVDQLDLASQQELAGFFQLPGFHLNTISTSLTPLEQNDQLQSILKQRLGSVKMELPPLRARAEDIPLLSQAILEGLNRNGNKQVSSIEPPALQLLQDYDWPENLDQLVAVITIAFDNCSGDSISLAMLPEFIQQEIKARQFATRPETKIELTPYLESIEAELIQRALTHSKGNKSRASRMLGISRPRLLRRLKQLNLEHWLETDSDQEPIEFLEDQDNKDPNH